MEIKAEKTKLHLKQPFQLSRPSDNVRENVIVEIEGNFGEGAPLYYLGETADYIYSASKEILEILEKKVGFDYLTENPWPRDLLKFPKPALSAVSQAVYGYLASQKGKPLYEYLGLPKPKDIKTSFSIGIVTPKQLEQILTENPDYAVYKLKLGGDDDIEIVSEFRKLSKAGLRLDINGGWNLKEATEKIGQLATFDIEFIEQPLPPGELDKLEELTYNTEIPIFIDEDLNVFSDILRYNGIADGINVKLSKGGLIFDTLRIIQYAKQLGLKILLGCMVESSVGITSALHIAGLADFIDLDGNKLIEDDPFVGADLKNGVLAIPEKSGTGARRR